MATKQTKGSPSKAGPRDGEPEGLISKKPPRSEAEQVCITRPARPERRVHTPNDLRRIYRYVVGSHGYAAATCAILQESGLQGLIEDAEERAAGSGLCEYAVDLSEYVEYVPDGSDAALGLSPGTVRSALSGCPAGEQLLSFVNQVRAALVVLIIIWGLWKKVTASRLYKLVIRRILVLFLLFEVLDRIERYIGTLIPVLLIISETLSAMQEICKNDESKDS